MLIKTISKVGGGGYSCSKGGMLVFARLGGARGGGGLRPIFSNSTMGIHGD